MHAAGSQRLFDLSSAAPPRLSLIVFGKDGLLNEYSDPDGMCDPLPHHSGDDSRPPRYRSWRHWLIRSCPQRSPPSCTSSSELFFLSHTRSCAATACGKSKRSSAASPIIPEPLLALMAFQRDGFGKLNCLLGFIKNVSGWLAQFAHAAMRGHLYLLAFAGGIYGDTRCQWVALWTVILLELGIHLPQPLCTILHMAAAFDLTPGAPIIAKVLLCCMSIYWPAFPSNSGTCAGTLGPHVQIGEEEASSVPTAAPIVETEPMAQESNDAALAAKLQQQDLDEAHASDSAPIASGGDSMRRTRTDEDMKNLLKALQVPHYVRKSKTHGQNNCLIDSILLALQEQKKIKPLEVDDRAAVCSSVRRNLIEHHGVAPESPEEGQAYLSHEGSFHDICTRLRIDHPDIWFEDIDPHRLPIMAVVFDKSQRRQVYDTRGEWAGEIPDDLTEPVASKPLIESDHLPEVYIRLYCNTHDDAHCTPYHYEWISCQEERNSEDEKSSVDGDDDVKSNPDPFAPAMSDENDDDNEDENDDEDNPAPPVQRLPVSDSNDDDDEENDTVPLPFAESNEDIPPPPPAPPLPMAGMESHDKDDAVSPLPEMPLRTQPSAHSALLR